MVSINDFKDDKGDVDWKAYRKAQIEHGDKCYKCETYITFNRGNTRSLCHECQSLLSKDETSHSSYIRCPSCSATWEPSDCEDFDCYNDGDHDVECPECDHKFKISTCVSYTFISPEMIEKPEEKDDEEEGEE